MWQASLPQEVMFNPVWEQMVAPALPRRKGARLLRILLRKLWGSALQSKDQGPRNVGKHTPIEHPGARHLITPEKSSWLMAVPTRGPTWGGFRCDASLVPVRPGRHDPCELAGWQGC